ncbi:MAG TPA: hypothetical protein K8W03_01385 [Bifidobacterium pseudolongum subsp. globosum]|nr:hypothetical protein [Bifidobacterium pseudolongum subsp. globosum]
MIPVFKPQHVRWLPKPITLWAVWEGTDGKHHEEAKEYTGPLEKIFLFNGYPRTVQWEDKSPLLTADYVEDPKRVLPGTLRFIRIEDLLKLYRYVDHQGNVYAIHWESYTQGRDRFRTLNGFELNMYNTEFDHIIYPPHVDQDEQLEPNEFNTDKEQEA